MQFSTVLLSLAAAVSVSAQGVPEGITPDGGAPQGCQETYDGSFQITVVKPSGTAKRDLQERASCGSGEGSLVITLENGIMKDQDQRTGYIASNFQFQFDGPPQAGAIYTGGFSVCGNNSIALGPTTVFYQCLSGGFYNLYNKDWAAQCSPVAIDVVPCDGSSGGSPEPAPTAAPAPTGAAPAPTGVSVQPDGQPTSGPAVTQIGDGQPQAAPSVAVGAGAVFGVSGQVVMGAAGLAAAALL